VLFRSLENVQQRLTPMLTEYGGQLTLPAEWPMAMGYAPWVEEVWANYISNAIKYGGRPPQIACGAVTLPHKAIEYWVQDNGSGLSPTALSGLFTPFNRKTDDSTEGHGLGLSIVRRIVTRLGGEVHVQTTPGAGSRFSFTLPAG